MKRGEIWTAAGGGGYAGKPRLVIILQDDRFAATHSVTVCGLTTTGVDAGFGRVPIRPTAQNGLTRDSWVMVDKIVTLRRNQLSRPIGCVAPHEMAEVNRALVVFLGLSA
jgi:mRNA interferase MazF